MPTSTLSAQTFQDIAYEIKDVLTSCSSIEDAARVLVDALYGPPLRSAVALVRVFMTLPFGVLPETERSFARQLAVDNGGEDLLRDQTPTLTLLATRGLEEDWNDRRRSQGHVAIPLLSSAFVGAIPMISRLVKELGVAIEGLDAPVPGFFSDQMGRVGSVFHVEDAKVARDVQGRLIIPVQDFVTTYGIQSVVGAGGGYLGTGNLVVFMLFARERVEASDARRASALMSVFRNATMSVAFDQRVWAAQGVWPT